MELYVIYRTSEMLHAINRTIVEELAVITHHRFSLYMHIHM